MGRVFLTIIVPLLLPTALYAVWRVLAGKQINVPAVWVWLTVAGLVRPPPPYKPDPVEVAEVFEVPLDFILDKRNHQWRSRELAGKQRFFWAIPYLHRNIWGATAGMLVNLAEVLGR